MSEPTSVWLTARDIRKSFSGREILHGVDFEVERGSVHALVGHNGAGKSTLIKVLAGMYPDHTGTVTVGGREVDLSSPRASAAAGIAVIHQEFSLVPEFTAAQNIYLGREPRKGGLVQHRRMARQARDFLDSVGLSIPLGIPVSRLSVAHQQLTEIAKALAAGAEVLIMDEPTSRLAPAERESLFTIIRRLTSEGVAVVYISHFLKEVLDISDRVTVLRNGAVAAAGEASGFTVEALADLIIGDTERTERTVRGALRTGEVVLELDDFAQEGRPGSSLTVRAGEVVGIAGLVGSGRSSLLESIAGARPSHGRLRVGRANVVPRTPAVASRAGIVLVPEDRKHRGLVMQQGVAQNVVLSALTRRFSRFGIVRSKRVERAAEEAIQTFRILVNDPSAPVGGLSGGNQQKVLLARATETAPRVLLFDQPTAGVDIGAKNEIYGHIDRLAERGAACVVTSDEIEELLAICDSIAIMRGGRLDAPIPVSELDEARILARMSVSEEGI